MAHRGIERRAEKHADGEKQGSIRHGGSMAPAKVRLRMFESLPAGHRPGRRCDRLRRLRIAMIAKSGSVSKQPASGLGCCHVPAGANRLPDRRDRGDALSPRRARAASSASQATPCGRRRCARKSPACRPSSAPTSRKSWRSKPDLVLTFSDLQADIVAELIRAGVAVHAFNQRDIAGIFAMIRTLGALIGAADKADALARALEERLEQVRARSARLGPGRASISRNGTSR